MEHIRKQAFIRQVALQNQRDVDGTHILWSRHALVELLSEAWTRLEVEAALCNGEVIEDYPTLHRPLPDCLVLSWLKGQEPLHSVVAIDETNHRLFVVTVYTPDAEEWNHDWRTRKS